MTTLSRTTGAAGSVTLTTKNTAGQLITPVSAPTVQWYTDAGRTTGILALVVTGAGSAYTASWTGPQAPAVPGTRYLKVTIETSTGVFSVDADDDISFVAAAADFSTGLCTVAEVKAQLGKTVTTDDVELQAYIDAATSMIEGYCGAVMPRTIVEWHDANGPDLLLRSERIVSVTSISSYLGGVAYPYTAAADPSAAGNYTYFVDPNLGGMVTRLGGGGSPAPFQGRLVVTYVAGFDVIPPALNLAARLIVQTMWRTQNGGAGLPQLSDEPETVLAGIDGPVPARAVMLMERYQRVPSIG